VLLCKKKSQEVLEAMAWTSQLGRKILDAKVLFPEQQHIVCH
jgi:hypothetical protein